VPIRERAIAKGPGNMDVLIPALAGVATTVVGVILGAMLTQRVQLRHWSRDRLTDACVSIVRESTRVQLNLRRKLRDPRHEISWEAWNESLALVHLTANAEITESAYRMDEAFWDASSQMKAGQITTDDEWAEIRDSMEGARAQFIATSRRYLLTGAPPPLPLVARPSLATVRSRYPRKIELFPTEEPEN
jgi:hypothetical protein